MSHLSHFLFMSVCNTTKASVSLVFRLEVEVMFAKTHQRLTVVYDLKLKETGTNFPKVSTHKG